MQRALDESARMTSAYLKDQRKVERTRQGLEGRLESALAEHAAEVLPPRPPQQGLTPVD